MYIYELIKDVEVVDIVGDNINITHMTFSTVDIQKGSLFFCIEGTKIDGHTLAQKAVELGAKALVIKRDVILEDSYSCGYSCGCSITKIIVEDTKEAMALMSANFYGDPSKYMDIIGVTGTNGKTTSTFMLKSILDRLNIKTGLLGTIYNISCSWIEESNRTTMESLDLHRELAAMHKDKIEACIMEVSSHSLALKRVFGVYFKIGIFTNLTQDHLDFHINMENYFEAKMKLFDNTEFSVINADDEYGKKAIARIYSRGCHNNSVISYGIENPEKCDVYAKDLFMNENGSNFILCYHNSDIPIKLNLPGKFNIYNALGAGAAALLLGVSLDKIKEGLETLESVPGRSERIKSNRGFTIIIDYAHTPDGIVNILKTAREFTLGKLYIVFGCGGDRDRTKRSVMGRCAGQLADYCIVTSDNPRSEDASKIIEDIIPGILETGCPFKKIIDRKEAIAFAIEIAKKGDVVIIAGKGHETYQIFKDKTIQFDERKIVKELLKGDF
jgi:UDP-N-acetylmuramoyl-L-alanyl-D-glutamate--2,6-diaminopimelate ligase